MKARSNRPWITADRMLQGVTFVMFLLTSYGISLRAEGEFKQWRQDRQMHELLKVVSRRQDRYFQVARNYAQSFKTLGLEMPKDLQASLFAGSMGGHPGFLVEVCLERRCWATDQSGAVRQRIEDRLPAPVTPEKRPVVAKRESEAPKESVVVPRGSTAAFGLKPGDVLPPLSPTRDSVALWGPIEEVKR